ncbi:MAG: AbrB/MazE/SpoVT family DNA-binding domain-containing protein [Firmicutes bacterium]|nr:AbrB/MazE/SpoVT family DNA-binding domain-containing protein [Bacillota bacterium]
MLSKIKDKNQLTIPQEIMKKLNLSKGDKVEIEVIDNMIVLKPVVVVEKSFWDDAKVQEAYASYLQDKKDNTLKAYDDTDIMFKDMGIDTDESL